jgi:hypothetical protein
VEAYSNIVFLLSVEIAAHFSFLGSGLIYTVVKYLNKKLSITGYVVLKKNQTEKRKARDV